MAHKGKFKPKNPHKYMGNSGEIVYRSSWELKLMLRLDAHPHVLEWGSEELIIPYRSPIDGKIHRYFPDFIIKLINKNGLKETLLVEIKPKVQTAPPEKRSKITKKYLNEVKTWGINKAKWDAAEAYCKDRGWSWKIMTETELGI